MPAGQQTINISLEINIKTLAYINIDIFKQRHLNNGI